MKPLADFKNKSIRVLFTDIDDTLTEHGKLPAESYAAMWKLAQNGIKVVPVTGRPAGWCEMIARFWPVDGVIGENGGFYFRYLENSKKMIRHFVVNEATRIANQKKLEKIRDEVLREVPGSAVASDQFSRLMDLAIDFCEDVPPLSEAAVDKIVSIFERNGATAKVSSIHVNGWFGSYDKLSMCKVFCKHELGFDLASNLSTCAFSGDSPNDEPMFEFFENSFAVANINQFLSRLKHKPAFVSSKNGAAGFVEIAERILAERQN